MFARTPSTAKTGNKRQRSNYSCTASFPTRKQSKTSATTSTNAANPTADTQRSTARRSSSSNADLSLQSLLESHLNNTSLDLWLAELKRTPSASHEKRPLQPSTTYIYMQLDPKDPRSYVCVPLPPSLVAQITKPPSSPGRSIAKSNGLERPLQIGTKAISSLQTPPQTPPRISTPRADMAELSDVFSGRKF
jgi:hypothetical protein